MKLFGGSVLWSLVAWTVVMMVFAQSNATLTVTSEPSGLRVMIGGLPKGNTPLTLQLPAGRHYIEWITPEGLPISRLVTLMEGTSTTEHLSPATLTVTSEPSGLRVILGGSLRGTTPLTLQAPAGTHSVAVQTPDFFSFSRQVTLMEGTSKTEHFDARLTRLTVDGTDLTRVASYAIVEVNDQPFGAISIGVPSVSGLIKPGTNRVKVKVQDTRYASYEESFVAEPGSTTTKVVPVRPAAQLSISSTPPGAAVFMDGIRRTLSDVATQPPQSGTPVQANTAYLITPTPPLAVTPGMHSLCLRHVEYEEFCESIDVPASPTPMQKTVTLQERSKLHLTSTPSGARYSIDYGSITGVTPAVVPLPARTYTFELSLAGYATKKDTFAISTGQQLYKDYTFKTPGTLSVNVLGSPQPKVCIQYHIGEDCRTPPISRLEMGEGSFPIILRWPQRPLATVTSTTYRQMVKTTDGEDTSITIDPYQIPTLTLLSKPSGARVIIDGTPEGTTPMDPLFLSPGDHVLRVTAMGYQDYVEQLRPVLGKHYSGMVVLSTDAPKGRLIVRTQTPGAIVSVNGMPKESLDAIELVPGSVIVRVSAPSYVESEQAVQITSGQETTIDVTLAPLPALPSGVVVHDASADKPLDYSVGARMVSSGQELAARLVDAEVLLQQSLTAKGITDADVFLSPSNTLVAYRKATLDYKDVAFVMAAIAQYYPYAPSLTVQYSLPNEPTLISISARLQDAQAYRASANLQALQQAWQEHAITGSLYCADTGVPCIQADPLDRVERFALSDLPVHASAVYRAPMVSIEGDLLFKRYAEAAGCAAGSACKGLADWVLKSKGQDVLIGNDPQLRARSPQVPALLNPFVRENLATRVRAIGRFVYADYLPPLVSAEDRALVELQPGKTWHFVPSVVYPLSTSLRSNSEGAPKKYPLLESADPTTCAAGVSHYAPYLATAYLTATREQPAVANAHPDLAGALFTTRAQGRPISGRVHTYSCAPFSQQALVSHVIRLLDHAQVAIKQHHAAYASAIDAQPGVVSNEQLAYVSAQKAALANSAYLYRRQDMDEIVGDMLAAWRRLDLWNQQSLLDRFSPATDEGKILKTELEAAYLSAYARMVDDGSLQSLLAQEEPRLSAASDAYLDALSQNFPTQDVVFRNMSLLAAEKKLRAVETEAYRRVQRESPALQCYADVQCGHGRCDPTTHRCTQSGCSDHLKDLDETGVDCGGACARLEHKRCASGVACSVNMDCASHVCQEGQCKTMLAIAGVSITPGNLLSVPANSALMSVNITAIGEPLKGVASFEVFLDGASVSTLPPALTITFRVNGLGRGRHRVTIRPMDADKRIVDRDLPIDFFADPQLVHDFDNDRLLTISDIRTLLEVVGGKPCPAEYSCDLDGDGAVTLADVDVLYTEL